MNKKQIRTKAMTILGKYSFNSKTGKFLKQRVEKMEQFIRETRNDDPFIVVNNNWSYPPKKSQWKEYAHIGGTTYQYQIWAVIK